MHETDFAGPPNTHLNFTRYYNSYDTSQAGLGIGVDTLAQTTS
jgi:Domain of unknown function (DUF6531)